MEGVGEKEPLTRTASPELNRTPVPETDEGFLRVTLLGRFEVSVGSRVVGGSGFDGAYAAVVGEDGRVVAGGKATNGSREDYALARYKANGSLDDEFDFDGGVLTDFGGTGGWLWDLALQDDGRVVAAGTSAAAGTGANMALARYNPGWQPQHRLRPRPQGHDGLFRCQRRGTRRHHRGERQDLRRRYHLGLGIRHKLCGGPVLWRSRRHAPRVNPLERSLVAGSTLGDPEVPVKLSWSATDAGGEVTGYQLQQSTYGNPYENVGLADATTTTRTLGFAPGSNYRLRVRATDDNGNRSDWKYGTRFALDTLQENDPSISYAKTWKGQSLASAYGGGVKYATARGAKATLSFTGTEVAWVAPESKTRGKAAVSLDGAKVATVNLFSRQTLARQVVFSRGNLDPATPHTLEVRSLGTSGRPRVDVDAFVVLR